MRDVHCHILPGVDDGARTMQESLLMLSEAMRAGITSIVCTPRCCDPWFDFSRMWQAYLQLKRHASAIPGAPELSMGFEVDYHKLKKLGMDAAVQLGNDQGEFLLELPQGTLPLDWEFMVHNLQRKGFKVIIANPERCREVQKDIDVARRFVSAGCELQISADCIYGGFLDPSRRAAKKLVQAGLVRYLASDARHPSDYELFTEAMEYFKRFADSEAMENKSIEEVERECAEAEARADQKRKGRGAGPDRGKVPAGVDGFARQAPASGERSFDSEAETYRSVMAAVEGIGGNAESVGPRSAAAPSVVRSSGGRRAMLDNSAANPGKLPLPVEGGAARASYLQSAEHSSDAALDAMFDDVPVRGKHARRE